MRRLLVLPVLLLSLLVGNPAISADFQKGLDAYDRGDFATALREWKPLAEQGDANAQVGLGVMYQEGQGVPQNYETAVKWYTLKGAKQRRLDTKRRQGDVKKGRGRANQDD